MELACGPLRSLSRGWIFGAQRRDVVRGVHNLLLREYGHATNSHLLQRLLQREDGHGCCLPGQRNHRDIYPMEAHWSPHDKAGRAFHSLSSALEREHGSCQCQRRSPLHPPWAGELLFPIFCAFDSGYLVSRLL